MAELLLQSGANVNIQNSSCWSALHLAVHCGKQECVQLLLEKDCDLFVKNKDGKTAEDLALATGNEAIVGLILKKRMDLLSVPSNTSNDLADTHGDCKICFEPKNGVFAFSPCFHAVACKDCCARIIEGDDNKCPICRKEVNEFKKIFM